MYLGKYFLFFFIFKKTYFPFSKSRLVFLTRTRSSTGIKVRVKTEASWYQLSL